MSALSAGRQGSMESVERCLHTADALVSISVRQSGITRAAAADEWEIHVSTFERFVDALVTRYQGSNHLSLRSLWKGSSPQHSSWSSGAEAMCRRWEGRSVPTPVTSR